MFNESLMNEYGFKCGVWDSVFVMNSLVILNTGFSLYIDEPCFSLEELGHSIGNKGY